MRSNLLVLFVFLIGLSLAACPPSRGSGRDDDDDDSAAGDDDDATDDDDDVSDDDDFSDDDDSTGGCGPDEVVDCYEGCTLASWIGDSICDPSLDCAAFAFDGGDCDSGDDDDSVGDDDDAVGDDDDSVIGDDDDSTGPTTTATVLGVGVPTPVPPTGSSGTTTSSSDTAPWGTIVDVDVTLDITHTWAADLDITLISPNGTTVELTSDNGGGSDNYTGTTFDDDAALPITSGSAPFTGSYQPEESLSNFDGENAAGVWFLEIVDDAGGDLGTLNSWSITLTLN